MDDIQTRRRSLLNNDVGASVKSVACQLYEVLALGPHFLYDARELYDCAERLVGQSQHSIYFIGDDETHEKRGAMHLPYSRPPFDSNECTPEFN